METVRTGPDAGGAERRPMGRRTLLAGAVGGAAALAAKGLVRADPARAGNVYVVLGTTNISDDGPTYFGRSANSSVALVAATDFAVRGEISEHDKVGVSGQADGETRSASPVERPA